MKPCEEDKFLRTTGQTLMGIVLGLFNTIHLLLHYLLLPPLISWVTHPNFFEEEEEETLISPKSIFFGKHWALLKIEDKGVFPLAHLYSLNTHKFNFGKIITDL